MRSIVVCVGLALVWSAACGAESLPFADAQSGDATEATDTALADPTGDVTAVQDTQEGGTKDDVSETPVTDGSASDDAALPVDQDAATAAADTDTAGLADDVEVPAADTASQDAEVTDLVADTASHDDVTEGSDASPDDDVTMAIDVTEDTVGTVDDTAAEDTEGQEDVVVAPDPCEACIASGGTWQPEANACTENCNIMDISCYTSSCPAPCSLESCGTCIGQQECEDTGCQWNAQPPAFWCNSFSP